MPNVLSSQYLVTSQLPPCKPFLNTKAQCVLTDPEHGLMGHVVATDERYTKTPKPGWAGPWAPTDIKKMEEAGAEV